MKYISKELIDWAVKKIQSDYPDDVSLLIGPKHCNLEPDGNEMAFNFFVPETERGFSFAKTFIIDGIGYDLFPISWKRLEGLANLNESITRCLADGVVIYSRNDNDRQRFMKLREKLLDNLKDPDFTYQKGLEKINVAMDLYKNMLFEDSLCKVRKASGYIAGYLSEAVAADNGTFFKRGPENQIDVINGIKHVPERFTVLYQGIVYAETLQEIKELCYQMISVTRAYFANKAPREDTKCRENNFEDLASWYEEGIYTFRRIYYYCDQKDVFNAFAWGYNFQQEFDSIKEELSLESMDIMSLFNSQDLSAFRKRTEEIERYIVSVIRKHGVTLREYSNLEEFLKANG